MGKVAFLFAGQGAQHPGMGKELACAEAAAKATFDALEAVMPGLSALCFEGTEEELTRTENTQPSVFAVDLAAARALVAHGVIPDAVAGFSLGEVAALTFAGAFGDEDGFALVRHRGDLMAACCAAHPSGMRAVVKLDAPTVEALAEQAGAWPVNYNSPQQTVVAGTPDALERLEALVKGARGRALKMAVAGAFHSPLMADASTGLASWLKACAPKPCAPPVWANTTGEPYPADPAAMAGLLAGQASHPVRWTRTLQGLRAQGFDTFVEVGPGSTLTKLVQRTLEGVCALACETPGQLSAVLETVGKE
ncbi:[acyl-carrier-protein] S-malonyltransferase [Olsenella profusa DSM 13989]|uniref:ACP S-malonyltransferase n=1 Tax=Olsenella profusa TaxID=138595 RepID=UPI0027849B41|nr:ACP S-malonyltransferase [Olsenella profusa]MDP9858410.1 [acyl-carrier-protein] S-malonyltransferase [Olsenella profusa DSM 13989]